MTRWMTRVWRVGAVLAVVAGAASTCAAQAPPPIFRVFLTDGTSVASFGEWVRVGERVVFTVAVGEQASAALHLASVPAERVDWPATEHYREGLRAAHYVATQGDADFAVMTEEVARLLSDAGLAEDPARKLALADEARRRLVEWPGAHYGYRADEVRQILMLVEEVVSGLRAARGDTSFDLRLVASAAPPPVRLLPPPTLRESITQALRLAELADTAADRQSLLRTVSGVLSAAPPAEGGAWVATSRTEAERALQEELALDARYARLRSTSLARASRAAARADVRGVERAITRYRRGDEQLGGRRAEASEGVLAALAAQLDAARRLRLARDQWAGKRDALLAYRRQGRAVLDELREGRGALDDIKQLAGPSPSRLDALERRTRGAQQRLARLVAPPDAQPVHALATSAAQLTLQAASLRRQAIAAGDLAVARDASAAAAGALMLADRARAELERVTRPPELQ